jgi:hypothetical protein
MRIIGDRQDFECDDNPFHRSLDFHSRPAANRQQNDVLSDDGAHQCDAFRLRRTVSPRETVEAL